MVRTTECVASVGPEYRDPGVQLNARRLKVPESPEQMHGKSPICFNGQSLIIYKWIIVHFFYD